MERQRSPRCGPGHRGLRGAGNGIKIGPRQLSSATQGPSALAADQAETSHSCPLGNAANALPFRMFFAGLLEEQLLTCLLAVAQSMFTLPGASQRGRARNLGLPPAPPPLQGTGRASRSG